MKGKLILALLLVPAFLLIVHMSAAAHGQTEVGDYELEIGFQNEPSLQGQPNGLELFVTNMKTGEMVNGLEETLKAEIIFGSSKKELELEPVEGEEGAYTAFIIPTELGDYTWHIIGTIEETPVDVSMTSSPDTFNSVEPTDEFLFPAAVAATNSSTQTAMLLGALGAILGLAGLIFGVLGYRAARRPQT